VDVALFEADCVFQEIDFIVHSLRASQMSSVVIVAPDQSFARLICIRLQMEGIGYSSYLKFELRDSPDFMADINKHFADFQNISQADFKALSSELSRFFEHKCAERERVLITDKIYLLPDVAEERLVICSAMNEDSWEPNLPGSYWIHPSLRQNSKTLIKNKIESSFNKLINSSSQIILTRSKKIFGVSVYKSSVLAKFEALCQKEVMPLKRCHFQTERHQRQDRPKSRRARLENVVISNKDVELLIRDPESFYSKKTLGLTSTDFDLKKSRMSYVMKRIVVDYFTYGLDAAVERLNQLKQIDIFSYQKGKNIIKWLESAEFRGPIYGNIFGQITVRESSSVDICGYADIIEKVGGALSIITCVTSTSPSTRDILYGSACGPLAICLIAKNGGFEELGCADVNEIQIWSLGLSGGAPISVKTLEISNDIIDSFKERLIVALDSYIAGDALADRDLNNRKDIYKHFKRS
jgi:hypothetical protein